MANLLKEKARSCRNLLKTFRLERAVGESLALDVASELWYRLDTPTSLGLYLCAKYGDFHAVLSHEVNPAWYTSADAFYLDHQAVSFLRKCPISAVPLQDRVSAATQKFWAAEEQCRETNARFRSRLSGRVSSPAVEAVLHSSQRKILSWIGEAPNPHEWARRCRFGPGADDLTKGPRVGAYHKLEALSATADFADGALALALDHPTWARHLSGLDTESEGSLGHIRIDIAPGNKVVFVPKTALIERSIAVEPRMNVFAQLGLGSLLRSFLKTRGKLDLDTQEPNQDLAFDASAHGHLATIDLSGASDTLSIELVRDLLPPGWFTSLDWCRSKRGTLNSRTFTYEKFSSMGNGYTFELESMIFYALTLAVCEYTGVVPHYTRVYGDDIVCPVEAVALLREVFTYCGFTINARKSFSTGVFRESCGADFFDGTNVRPHFCKEVPTNVQALFSLANGIRRAGHRLGRDSYCDRRFRPAWLRTVRRIPKLLRSLAVVPTITERLWGSEIGAGDGGLVLNPDEFLSTIFARFARRYQGGWFFGTSVPRPWIERRETSPLVTLSYALYRCKDGLPDDALPGLISGRGIVGQQLHLRAYTRELVDLGPWL